MDAQLRALKVEEAERLAIARPLTALIGIDLYAAYSHVMERLVFWTETIETKKVNTNRTPEKEAAYQKLTISIAEWRRANAGKGPGNDLQNYDLGSHLSRETPTAILSEPQKAADAIHQRMKPFRTKILPARNKLAAHADRAAVSGPALGTASWQEWAQFWSDLADFVRTLNEQMKGKPFEIDAAGVMGDAEMMLKALAHARHFDTLLKSSDPTVKAACLKVALPES